MFLGPSGQVNLKNLTFGDLQWALRELSSVSGRVSLLLHAGPQAADRNTHECAGLCFSGVPIDSRSSLGEVMKDAENGLFSVLRTIQTGPGLEGFLRWHCSCQTPLLEALSEFSSRPPPGLLPGHAASCSRSCICIPALALPESCPVICPQPYQHLSSCPIWKVGPVSITSLKWEICSELLHG